MSVNSMPGKRKLADCSDIPRSEPPKKKKHRLRDSTTTIPSSTSAAMHLHGDQEPGTPRKTFFDLPAELRNQIYEDVYDELVATPKHPWDPQPSNTRFKQYVNLLLANHQVRSEAESLFLNDYSHRVVFYFDNAAELLKLHDVHNDPAHYVLGRARFSLNTPEDLDEENHEFELQDITEGVWEQQPGFKRGWTMKPGYYITSEEWLKRWEPATHGFQRFVGDHSCCAKPQQCRPYEVLKWPPFMNGCQLTTYQYQAVPRFPNKDERSGEAVQLGGMVFEGSIRDLVVGDFGREAADAALAHTQDDRCEPSYFHTCHICHSHPEDEDDCSLCHARVGSPSEVSDSDHWI